MTKIHILQYKKVFFYELHFKIILNTASWQKIILIKCISSGIVFFHNIFTVR